eukprot:CAMPEP_0194574918 /NCGR_PEP_ID=MMETSP0292-20121207/10591_1 /TAXON_ID=39354 /ORGANISM="Heterosigma akashiwo, Strain CCMP2393" /LENGTH=411 /DNA_ID=CAMNT_0039426563 /DNA_START=42 /DNA_END=1277 /DNA_ORIENTATION=+
MSLANLSTIGRKALLRGTATSAAKRALGTEALARTAFFDLHKELGGKIVPFAGYELPVEYTGENGGIMKEHLWCREEGKASLFDVSHMGQLKWTGSQAADFIEKMVVGDIKGLKEGAGRLSLITNENGGILDDTVITNAGDYIYMVVNGACKHKDMAHFDQHLAASGMDARYEYCEDLQLLALQGLGAAAVLAPLLPAGLDLNSLAFMTGVDCTLDGIAGCRVTRCGYTGEDGFELSVPGASAVALAQRLLENPAVNPTGLGARDSLRLEAGLCLYGNDLDETTTPVEGALAWTMGGPKGRRRLEQGFLGADKFLTPEGKLKGSGRKRVGLAGMRAPARAHTEIYDPSGETLIGEVTSGTFSPCLKAPIAMGYVQKAFEKEGTEVAVKVRGKMQAAQITKMPFVEQRYFRG